MSKNAKKLQKSKNLMTMRFFGQDAQFREKIFVENAGTISLDFFPVLWYSGSSAAWLRRRAGQTLRYRVARALSRIKVKKKQKKIGCV